ncbi:MAG: M20/M25/M40 family metallo-hydrolase [Anaerolineae bacterium]|nr:M20/M25/M40 family metallo-hydrolase [Anaerolineae bacterium]
MSESVSQIFADLDLRALASASSWAVEQSLQIQRIPAPTFQEGERAAYVAEQMKALDLEQVEIDDMYNVYGLLRGANQDAMHLMISAHLDTVFPIQTDLSNRREYESIYGPGLGDNSLGVASLLAVAQYLRDTRALPACNIWFVATTREEGLGDLGGMKVAFERLRGCVSRVINLEGLAYGYVYNCGIAVRRLEISAHADGGHSWLHFGRSSAIHGLIELGARICSMHPPANPRTTYNIGMIAGGSSINTVAAEARMWLDLRSESRIALEELEQKVRAHIAAVRSATLRFDVEIVGDRPAGTVAASHELVQDSLTILRLLGVHGALEAGSTDANVPLAAGCPAVTIGVTTGGNAHRLDEYIDLAPVMDGLKQLITLTFISAERIAGVS